MSTDLAILAVTTAMIGVTVLYVAAEFATVSAHRHRIVQQAVEGNRYARMLVPIMATPAHLDTSIAACQGSSTIPSHVLGFYGQSAMAGALAPLFSFSGACNRRSVTP